MLVNNVIIVAQMQASFYLLVAFDDKTIIDECSSRNSFDNRSPDLGYAISFKLYPFELKKLTFTKYIY